MSLKVTYKWSCEACDDIEERAWDVSHRFVPPNPYAPEGWQELLGCYYCRKHDVSVKVDVTPKGVRAAETHQ